MNALSPAVPRPSHVAPEAVYDFDIYLDPALLENPHERARELLRVAPKVFWTPRNGGHWLVTGHKENYEASRNTEVFSSVLAPPEEMEMVLKALPNVGRFPQPAPITMDPPAHTALRAPLNTAFSPKAMLARKEEVRALANELIDAVKGQGYCDFIPDIAEPLPVQVFLKLMGLPVEQMAEFRALVHEFLAPQDSPLDGFLRMRKIAEALRPAIEARRDDPRDDLISTLWRTEIEGKPMTYEVMEDFGVLLFIAGLDTVINGMGFGIRHLARHPELQDELRGNPKRIVQAAEEILRRYTFTVPMRRIAQDTSFGGWEMKEDERLMLFLPGADLDEREFPEPEKFDPDRENNVHIAFGVGPHRCVGSHLARIELQVIYEQMLEKLPTFRLDDKPAKFHAGNIIAMDSLPLRWD